MGGGAGGGRFKNTRGWRENLRIHQGKQDKHIEGSRNYNQQWRNGKKPSILTADPDELLREGAGKGYQVGENKEIVDYDRSIGKYFHEKSGQYYDTTRAAIHYDSKGNVHIVPARPTGFHD